MDSRRQSGKDHRANGDEKTRRTFHFLFQVDLNHKSGQIVVDVGVDLTDYYPSIEWDILLAVSRKMQRTMLVSMEYAKVLSREMTRSN